MYAYDLSQYLIYHAAFQWVVTNYQHYIESSLLNFIIVLKFLY